MFNNIGGKIKVFVITVTMLVIISCVVCGIAVIAFSVFGDNVIGPLSKVGLDTPVLNLAGDYEGPLGIVVGLVIMILGSLAAWLLAFIPYGLGQLIQNTEKIAKGIDGIRAVLSKNAHSPAQNGMPSYVNPVYNPYGAPVYIPQYPAQSNPVQNNPVQNAPAQDEKPFEDAPVENDFDKTVNVRTAEAASAEDKTAPKKFPFTKTDSAKNTAEDIFDVIDKTVTVAHTAETEAAADADNSVNAESNPAQSEA